MRIGGIQKLTLIDYPGVIATTIFTVGCSFRCGFCHNPELVLPEKFPEMNEMEKEFFEHLEKRKGKLEGVCITGGEPTIQPDIVEFIRKIKEMGYLVKLDSNGSNPNVLEKIIQEGLADYIAMDIKSSPEKYSQVVGLKVDVEKIKKSVKMIMESGLPYEFRTTVVPGVHSEKDFDEIADWIKGAKSYYLQEYRNAEIIDAKLKGLIRGKVLDLEKIKTSIESRIEKVDIRRNN
ncbi:MAG: hypothetical protein ACD_56C00048G0006 [uncultured bacterium]|nr:MAG: hypothetical protein ACD_56C00048G0006 [uncultured bacterium]